MLLTKFPLGAARPPLQPDPRLRQLVGLLGAHWREEVPLYVSTLRSGSWVGSASRTSGRWRGSRSISISSAIPNILPIEICLNQASWIKSSLNWTPEWKWSWKYPNVRIVDDRFRATLDKYKCLRNPAIFVYVSQVIWIIWNLHQELISWSLFSSQHFYFWCDVMSICEGRNNAAPHALILMSNKPNRSAATLSNLISMHLQADAR